MDITILKKIGLSDKEIKVYLKLLEYGAISVRGLADLTNLNRGTVYDTLKRLEDMNLVSYYHHDTKQKFVAQEPEVLNKLLCERESELKKIKDKFNEFIPELKSLQDKDGSGPTTKLYEGKRGVKFILDDLLDTLNRKHEKEYYIYSATNVSDDINNAFPDFTKERIKKKVKVRAISLAKGGGMHGLDERRWLGTNEESATFVLIYSGKCAFISRDSKGMPVGVIIENEMIYVTQRVIFLRLWELLK